MQVEFKGEVILLKAKRYFVGAAALLTLLINVPQVSADEVETFGSEFEDDEEVIPFKNSAPIEDDEDFGEVLIFNDITDSTSPTTEQPTSPIIEQPTEPDEIIIVPPPIKENNLNNNEPEVIIENYDSNERILPPPNYARPNTAESADKKYKTLKPRFVKLTTDDKYTYYLDKQSVAWQRIPYSASEYMLDVWIRMIELEPDNSDLPPDMIEYVNDNSNGEIDVAREKGIMFAQIDVEVLQHKKYYLEHYYLRPKTRQIQFLCELEVIGRPQNTISERSYSYKNWENLIPSSMESILYSTVMKEVGSSGSADKGHMSFVDMLEEYARISMR